MGKKEAHILDKKIKTKQAAINVFPSTNAGTDTEAHYPGMRQGSGEVACLLWEGLEEKPRHLIISNPATYLFRGREWSYASASSFQPGTNSFASEILGA